MGVHVCRFLSDLGRDKNVVTKEDEKITNYFPLAERKSIRSIACVYYDCVIGGWLFGFGVL